MYLYCETCKDETEHELIRVEKHLYRCKECGTVSQHIPKEKIRVKAIISSGAESEAGSVLLKEDDVVEVGNELVVEVEEGFKVGEVTSVEFLNGKRGEEGRVKNIQAIWLRDVGEVIIRLSLHKKAVTTPYQLSTPGETEFKIGEVLNINGRIFRITKVRLLNGRLLKRHGDIAKAKEIKRIYAMYERRR